MPASLWTLTPQQVIDSPEISILIFHNVYPEGKQGGVEIIQHGERVATCGDLRLEPAPGQWAPLPKVQGRLVDAQSGRVTVRLAFSQPDIPYAVRVWTAGDQVELAVDLERPLPAEWEGKVGFNLELRPDTLMGSVYFMDSAGGTFPRQANSPRVFQPSGMLMPQPMARGRHFVAAPEDPLRRLSIRSGQGELVLLDGRSASHNGWFVLRSLAASGATRDAVRWTITPNRSVDWQRPPAILVSQVGYHPDQEKEALIELDPRIEQGQPCTLVRIQPDGSQQVVQQGLPEMPVRFLRFRYARFGFSAVREPGMYILRCGPVRSAPFKISRDVYQSGVWQPTLETFLPVQMCHVRVEDGMRVWHGACHLDDALQAPPDHTHFDGYQQYENPDTHYSPYAHIPGLDRGGWHDAGDYDLAAGSQASTTYQLALAQEAFSVDSDQTTVRREERLVLLHQPDGVPDIIQQVAHGVENLLGGYRAAGHSFTGIIEGSIQQYVHLGDAATMTDNRVFESGAADAPANRDDRWAFTNRNTALEYQVAAALAAASRVLRGYEETLAEECLTTARGIWEYEHSHEAAVHPVVYVWNNPGAMEVLAAVELLITSGEAFYGSRLVELLPEIEQYFGEIGWAGVRALPLISGGDFQNRVRQAAAAYHDQLSAEMAESPFRLPFGEGWLRANRPDHNPFAENYHPPIWGVGWSLQSFAVHYYFLLRAFPDVFDREPLLRVLHYVLGWHPAGNLSLVSGVGSQSLTIAYGTNRAEWSYIPGGIASGPALIRPDWLELMDPLPWLWQQKEYVIGGAASYLFLVLAADALLNGG